MLRRKLPSLLSDKFWMCRVPSNNDIWMFHLAPNRSKLISLRIVILLMMVLSLSYAARVTAHPKPALQPSGRIRGVTLAATADRRERLPRVVLVLTGPALGDNKLSIFSDDQGEYSFNRLAAGDYTLAATHAGFERLE
jgi:hypothetical protein